MSLKALVRAAPLLLTRAYVMASSKATSEAQAYKDAASSAENIEALLQKLRNAGEDPAFQCGEVLQIASQLESSGQSHGPALTAWLLQLRQLVSTDNRGPKRLQRIHAASHVIEKLFRLDPASTCQVLSDLPRKERQQTIQCLKQAFKVICESWDATQHLDTPAVLARALLFLLGSSVLHDAANRMAEDHFTSSLITYICGAAFPYQAASCDVGSNLTTGGHAMGKETSCGHYMLSILLILTNTGLVKDLTSDARAALNDFLSRRATLHHLSIVSALTACPAVCNAVPNSLLHRIESVVKHFESAIHFGTVTHQAPLQTQGSQPSTPCCHADDRNAPHSPQGSLQQASHSLHGMLSLSNHLQSLFQSPSLNAQTASLWFHLTTTIPAALVSRVKATISSIKQTVQGGLAASSPYKLATMSQGPNAASGSDIQAALAAGTSILHELLTMLRHLSDWQPLARDMALRHSSAVWEALSGLPAELIHSRPDTHQDIILACNIMRQLLEESDTAPSMTPAQASAMHAWMLEWLRATCADKVLRAASHVLQCLTLLYSFYSPDAEAQPPGIGAAGPSHHVADHSSQMAQALQELVEAAVAVDQPSLSDQADCVNCLEALVSHDEGGKPACQLMWGLHSAATGHTLAEDLARLLIQAASQATQHGQADDNVYVMLKAGGAVLEQLCQWLQDPSRAAFEQAVGQPMNLTHTGDAAMSLLQCPDARVQAQGVLLLSRLTAVMRKHAQLNLHPEQIPMQLYQQPSLASCLIGWLRPRAGRIDMVAYPNFYIAAEACEALSSLAAVIIANPQLDADHSHTVALLQQLLHPVHAQSPASAVASTVLQQLHALVDSCLTSGFSTFTLRMQVLTSYCRLLCNISSLAQSITTAGSVLAQQAFECVCRPGVVSKLHAVLQHATGTQQLAVRCRKAAREALQALEQVQPAQHIQAMQLAHPLQHVPPVQLRHSARLAQLNQHPDVTTIPSGAQACDAGSGALCENKDNSLVSRPEATIPSTAMPALRATILTHPMPQQHVQVPHGLVMPAVTMHTGAPRPMIDGAIDITAEHSTPTEPTSITAETFTETMLPHDAAAPRIRLQSVAPADQAATTTNHTEVMPLEQAGQTVVLPMGAALSVPHLHDLAIIMNSFTNPPSAPALLTPAVAATSALARDMPSMMHNLGAPLPDMLLSDNQISIRTADAALLPSCKPTPVTVRPTYAASLPVTIDVLAEMTPHSAPPVASTMVVGIPSSLTCGSTPATPRPAHTQPGDSVVATAPTLQSPAQTLPHVSPMATCNFVQAAAVQTSDQDVIQSPPIEPLPLPHQPAARDPRIAGASRTGPSKETPHQLLAPPALTASPQQQPASQAFSALLQSTQQLPSAPSAEKSDMEHPAGVLEPFQQQIQAGVHHPMHVGIAADAQQQLLQHGMQRVHAGVYLPGPIPVHTLQFPGTFKAMQPVTSPVGMLSSGTATTTPGIVSTTHSPRSQAPINQQPSEPSLLRLPQIPPVDTMCMHTTSSPPAQKETAFAPSSSVETMPQPADGGTQQGGTSASGAKRMQQVPAAMGLTQQADAEASYEPRATALLEPAGQSPHAQECNECDGPASKRRRPNAEELQCVQGPSAVPQEAQDILSITGTDVCPQPPSVLLPQQSQQQPQEQTMPQPPPLELLSPLEQELLACLETEAEGLPKAMVDSGVNLKEAAEQLTACGLVHVNAQNFVQLSMPTSEIHTLLDVLVPFVHATLKGLAQCKCNLRTLNLLVQELGGLAVGMHLEKATRVLVAKQAAIMKGSFIQLKLQRT